MFPAERWAEAFVHAAGTLEAGPAASLQSAGEGLAFLRAVLPLLREIPGEAAGYAMALRLEKTLRAALAKTAAGKSPGPEAALRLIVLLVKKGRLPQGDELTGAIEKIIDLRRGLLECVLESAAAPEEDFLEDLKTVLLKKTGAPEIRLLCRIQPELLAGFRLRLGDEVLDLSLRGQLGRMAVDLGAAPWGLEVPGLSNPGPRGGV
jgi:F-type H+-transporting ATPase subunit delta